MLAGGEALAEAVGRAAELEQVAAVREPIEERRGEPLVAREDGRPVGELEVARDDQGPPGIAVGEEREQQLGLVAGQADKAELVADQQIEPIERGLQTGQAMLGLGLGKLADETRPATVTKRTRLPNRQAARPSAVATWVLPVPGGPTARITSRRSR